jgi:3-hydroxyisobutyrate dehydrogenase-like beta-hydroxyacid dehydrogenase
MAGRLLSGGIPLVVYNRDRAKAEPFLAAGAEWADSPKAVGRAASGGLVFVMVTDVRAVRAVLFGPKGAAAGAGPGTLIVNLSTIAPEESRAVAERLGRRGIHYLEAPVAGSLDAAKRGELIIFAGGEAADLVKARPCLERFARSVEHLGPVGAGASMKLVNNLVMVATLAADAEAIVLAEAFGLNPTRVVDLLLAGGGASKALENKRDAFLRRDYAVKFKLALADKDLRLVGRAARGVGARTPIAREAKRLADEAMRAGFADRDLSAMLEAARGRRRGDRPPGEGPLAPAAEPPPTSNGASAPR